MVAESYSFVEFIYCACGCGRKLEKKFYYKHRIKIVKRFIEGHNTRKPPIKSVEFVYCKCGCGLTRPKYHRWRESQYIQGHSLKQGFYRDNHHNWKGGIYYDARGYRNVLVPEHHFADSRGYVREHRLVWERHYKASLLPWADVHHINGMKNDNSIENLKAMMHNRHSKTTHKKDMSNRLCTNCNCKSLIIQNKRTTWAKNPIGEGYICKRCLDNLLYGLKTVGW